MMQSSSRRALYTGLTNGLYKRVRQHKLGDFEGYSNLYNAHRLVYFEVFRNIHAAIRREKQIKGWTRAKKIALIESMNPEWKDLSAQWYQAQDPSLRSG
jgi:putative endonuclease